MKIALSAASFIAIFGRAAAVLAASIMEEGEVDLRRALTEHVLNAAVVANSVTPGPPCYTVTSSETLDEDVICDCGSKASPPSSVIEVVGPAVLDMNGYTAKCSSGFTTKGTVVGVGKGARIKNGYVYGSAGDLGDCIRLLDDGYHGLKNMVVQNCPRSCILTLGSHNVVTKSDVSYCTIGGITSFADHDTIKFNSAYRSDVGIVTFGGPARVQSNYVGFTRIGFGVTESGKYFFYNEAIDSGVGILLDETATDSEVRGNICSGNVQAGIAVFGSSSLIWYNRLLNNGDFGIGATPPAMDNELKFNIAFDTAGFDFADNTTCANTWYANKGELLDMC